MMRALLAHLFLMVACLVPAQAADIEALERQLDQARDAAPMVIKSFTPVAKPAQYFGDYEPRKDTVYRRGEKLYFYGEPKNLAFPKNAKGLFEPAFEVDVEIGGPDGKSMKQTKLISFRLPTRSRVNDLFLNLSLSLSSAPPGKYNVKFIVRDMNSTKSAAAATDVTIK